MATQPAAAADYVWVGGNWQDLGSWTVGGDPAATLPGPGDSIVDHTGSGTYQMNLSSITIDNWTFDSSTGNDIQFYNQMGNAGSPAQFTITGELSKTGSDTLHLRGSGSNVFMAVDIGTMAVSAGTLNLGTSYHLHSFMAGSANLSGGTTTIHAGSNADNQAGTTFATIMGDLTMSGSSVLQIRNSYSSASTVYGRLEAGSLHSVDTTPIIRVNNLGPSGSANHAHGTLILNNPENTSASFAGILYGADGRNILAVEKIGLGTQIFTGNSNSYNDGTTINAGALLLNNTAGSGTGTGFVMVNANGTLGGEGRIAPTKENGLSIAGTLSPGAAAWAIGDFEINLGGTDGVMTMQPGGSLLMDLGTAGASINAPGTSDLLLLTGVSAGDFTFDNTVINLTGGEPGWYKLLETDAGQTTWNGLALSGQTITGGLTLGSGYGGTLVMGDGTSGDAGAIYVNIAAVPEPAGLALLGLAVPALLRRRKTRVEPRTL